MPFDLNTAADRDLAVRVRALLDLPQGTPDWAPQAARLMQETTARGLGGTDKARGLFLLWERSGSPSAVPDTPAGQMWLRETGKALLLAARDGESR